MKIAIISDIHNNEVNLKKVLGYCAQNKIEKIICCGDLASMEILDLLNDNFQEEVLFTFGNMDNDFLRNYPFECHPELVSGSGFRIKSGMTFNYKNTKIFKDFGETEINNIKIAFVHFPEVAKELCNTGKYNFVFHGHTHKPWQEKINNCTLLNPGNVAGDIFPPTFAIWNTETDKFDLVRVHDLK